MHTVRIGSREWCLEWASFYREQAAKYAARDTEEGYIFAMYNLFRAYVWEDTAPWA